VRKEFSKVDCIGLLVGQRELLAVLPSGSARADSRWPGKIGGMYVRFLNGCTFVHLWLSEQLPMYVC